MKSIDKFLGQFNLRAAYMTLIIVPALFLIFHTLIIAGILPRNIVWSGRLTSATFLPFELLSLTINLLLIITGSVSGKIITAKAAITLVNWIKWFLFYFIIINTFVGLFSTTTLEVLMTPITALYALCLYRIIKFSDGLGLDAVTKT